uniref:BTB domain-containing protein n=1 Tax=Anopheles christyi TaxID=43041 RepID=A0A182KBE9_9DIPT
MADDSCLTWLNFREHMLNAYYGIFQTQHYTDCRLIVPDGELYANCPILSMASSFFEKILGEGAQPSVGAEIATILIPDLKLAALRSVLQFIYTGEVSVSPYEMAPFVEACSFLQIRGVRFVEDRIVGIRFGKTIGLMSEEPITPSEGFATTDCFAEELFIGPEEDERNDISKVQPRSDECFIPESSTTVPECEVESNGIVQIALNVESESRASERRDGERGEVPQDRLTQAIETILKEHESYQMATIPQCIETNVTNSTETKAPNTPTTDEYELVLPQTLPSSDPCSYEARLDAAIDAVLNQGISYRVASRKYNISKTVLWRKMVKMNRPVRASSPKISHQRREAIDALKSGEKLIHVSRRFEIPLSTLHREKQRLHSKGVLPSSVSLKLRGKDETVRKRLMEAVSECVAGRMSLSEAARVYGLPKTSIWRRVRSLQTSTETSSVKQGEHIRDEEIAETRYQKEESIEEENEAEQSMGGVLLSASDTLEVGVMYIPNGNISSSDLAQLRIQLASNYDHHVMNDSSQ